MEAKPVIQARHDNGQDPGGRRGGGEKRSDSGYVSEESAVGHAVGLNVGIMGKRKIKDHFLDFSLRNHVNDGSVHLVRNG